MRHTEYSAFSHSPVVSILTILLLSLNPVLTQAGNMGPLDSILPASGGDGTWHYRNDATGFSMINNNDPGAIQYFYLLPQPGTEGRRLIQVNAVRPVDSEDWAAAGLLYGFDPDTGNYFVLSIDSEGVAAIYRRDENGLNPIIVSEHDLVRPGRNHLSIRENGGHVELLVNGRRIGELPMNGSGHGAVGIASGGIGTMSFSGFSVTTQHTAAAGSPGRQPQPVTRAAQQPKKSQNQPMHVKPIQILDDTGPFGRMVAYSALVPTGWKTKGGISWNPPSGCYVGPGLEWGAASPDETYSLALLPPISWSASSAGALGVGCLSADLPDAEAAARAYLDALGLDYQMIAAERPPEIMRVVESFGAQFTALPSLQGQQKWADGVALRLLTTNEGKQSDMAFVALTLHWSNTMADGWGGVLQSRGGNMIIAVGLSTPVGKLDEGHPGIGTIFSNLRMNPQWNQKVQQWLANYYRKKNQSARTSTNRSDTGSVTDMMFESWKKREGMRDKGHASSIDSIWEVERYQTSSGQVALPQDYRNVWELQDGSLVLTNDNLFNPMQTFKQFGGQLKRVDN